jgi:NADH-quinone oxidoreductase subunit K
MEIFNWLNSLKVGLSDYLILSAIVFVIGITGIFVNRKNLIIILMSIELMLLAININLIAFSNSLQDLTGQIYTIFILTVAAAEAAIGLAIVVLYYKNRGSIAIEDIHQMKG